MQNLFKNTKGAVTIFVTLLLIPAVLVSGTAVDLARLHTARSILQDANQLAANSVLTQYNALLYDLYGLFGVAEDDPILGQLLDEYIRVSVFGEHTQDRTLGTLQVFYGSNITLDEPRFYPDMNLESADVLRRQIEEYMKFRGPVIIVKEILEALDDNTLMADKEIIESKTAIDADLAALNEKYKELHSAIAAADRCLLPIGGISGGHFGTVSSHLKLIRAQFVELKSCYEAWESLANSEDEGGEENERLKNDYAAKYAAILDNIKALTIGGTRGSNWSEGRWLTNGSGRTGLISHIEGAKQSGENFKAKFDAVVEIAREIDAMNNDLSLKVDDLENKLNSSECNEELKRGLTEKQGNPPMSLIERYRDILKWDDITAMGAAYRDGGYSYIDDVFKPMLDGIEYRNSSDPSSAGLTLEELENLRSNPGFALSEDMPAQSNMAALFAGFPENSVGYSMPPGFLKFAEHPGENAAFFSSLAAMANQPPLDPIKLYDGQEDAEGADVEAKQRNMIDELLGLADTAYSGLTNNPLGAKYINDAHTPAPESLGILDILALIPQALTEPIVSIVGDLRGSITGVGEHILLLSYSTSVFSNYSTAKPETIGKTKEDLSGLDMPKSLTGIPMNTDVNYFFQSEWEYLYHGSQNAGENLNAVTRLLFMVRLICNYITVFSVSEVTSVVASIQTAFAWMPPLGLLLGELARAAFVAAETVADVAALRSGHKAPIFKNASAGEWLCSPSGISSVINGIIAEGAIAESLFSSDRGLSYSHYMLFFFLKKAVFYFGTESDAGTELALRTGNLIEWNMINKQNGIDADEEKMADALTDDGRFMLSNMSVGFSLNTTANMRMLFLSMPLAQRGVGGIIPAETLPITAIDYRGY